MTCPRCSAELPAGAAFCHACGTDPVHGDARHGGRRHSYAVQPGESVWSFNVVSSLMPLASERTPQTYRFALLGGAAIPAIAAALGWLPFAVAAAAVLVPTIYLIYLYDVNEWEDQPVPVVAGTVVVSGVLAVVATWLWNDVLMPEEAFGLQRIGDTSVSTFVVMCVVAPVIGEIARQVGPLWLARRPAFDDLIDAVTFAVAAGATYACVETFVVNRQMLFDGPVSVDGSDATQWWMLLVTAGIVKPIVYGSATALALGAFSGIGAGYDGFSARYAGATLESIGYVALFSAGQYWSNQLEGSTGNLVGLITALVVMAVVVIRVRLVLHSALMEGALEAARSGHPGLHAAAGEAYCGNCDMPLLPTAAFCSACGTSTRAVPKRRRSFNEAEDQTLVTTEVSQ